MFAVGRTANVPGRIRLRDFVVKMFSCDFRYTLGALLKYIRHMSKVWIFFFLRWSSPPSKIFAAHVVYILYAKFSRVRQSYKELREPLSETFCFKLLSFPRIKKCVFVLGLKGELD
jgi:hypothetical protein